MPRSVWKVLEDIGKVWQENPEDSLASLIVKRIPNTHDLYLMKDEDLVRYLQRGEPNG